MVLGNHGRLVLKGDVVMHGIVDRLSVLICCSALLLGGAEGVCAVVAMLAAMTVSASNGYLKSRLLLRASIASYTVAAMVWPDFCLFLPLVFYDAMLDSLAPGQRWWLLAAAGSLVVCFANLTVGRAFMITALMAVTYVLALRTKEVEHSRAELMQLRDNSYELATLLRQQNRSLMEKQDYEVRLATLNERARIAREIHDQVGHLLSRSILQVGALMVTRGDDGERKSLAVVRDTLSQAMDSIRASVHGLHDESLDLRMQIECLVQEFTFCPIRLDYRLEREPEKDIAYCFIAIVKEGLNNIIRHSNATQVTLALLEHPALYQLVLQDNGSTGASEATAAGATAAGATAARRAKASGPGEGLGLRSMTDRVAALGGRLLVERHGGFRLFISVPKGRQLHESADS